MAVLAQLFAATHTQALARADALDAGRDPGAAEPHVGLPGLTALELEVLGEIAARAVRFGTGDLEAADVDLDHDQLQRMPAFWTEVMAELAAPEDPEAPDDVARAWAASEEMGEPDTDLLPRVRAVAALAAQAREAGLDLYVWSPAD
ncbi:hypothetical protein [Actinotalea subterranea]|uniref:hypothetical protein n=1 Tax=Actinotalea subterranea TaxID=2607497 RepID=UPI0011EDD47D|nr:hypothetical protein [Actinotalea subterranea]